jgi:preprotein translocase subunit SecE
LTGARGGDTLTPIVQRHGGVGLIFGLPYRREAIGTHFFRHENERIPPDGTTKDTAMASVRNTGKGAIVPRDSSTGKLRQFLQETWVELRYKVTWPSRTQLIRTTMVVLSVVILVSLFIYIADMFFGFVLRHTILAPR